VRLALGFWLSLFFGAASLYLFAHVYQSLPLGRPVSVAAVGGGIAESLGFIFSSNFAS